MKFQHDFVEEMTIFSSIIKWTGYASIVGVLVGAGTSAFLVLLGFATQKIVQYPLYYLILPLSILATSGLIVWLAPEAAGHGTEKVIEAIHQRMGRIPFAVVPVKLFATVITIATGGSAGKEGPSAQIGAGLASAFADFLKVDDTDRRKLVICGISAGFATVFGTPIAGALFGIEVLVVGQIFSEVLFPSVVAGIIGYNVALALGIKYTIASACCAVVPHLTEWIFVRMIMLGIWSGLVSLMLIEILKLSGNIYTRLQWHWTLKALTGGILLAVIGRFISTDYLGLGVPTIESGLAGNPLPAGAFFWKSIATSITLGSGGSGGVVTPIFFVGTAAGNLFAQLFDPVNIATCSAIGLTALLAGAANTPIAASVMAMELFGPQIGSFAAIACMVSFLMTGYRSIYPSQLLGAQKSRSLTVPTGSPIGEMDPTHVALREKSLLGILVKIFSRLNKMMGKNDDEKP
jgi:H+/Cl- antiporter ClcA